MSLLWSILLIVTNKIELDDDDNDDVNDADELMMM